MSPKRFGAFVALITLFLYTVAALISDLVTSLLDLDAIPGTVESNIAGTIGAVLAYGIRAAWGWLTPIVPLSLLYLSISVIRSWEIGRALKDLAAGYGAAVLVAGLLAALSSGVADSPGPGGLIGRTIHHLLAGPFGIIGAILIPAAILVALSAALIEHLRSWKRNGASFAESLVEHLVVLAGRIGSSTGQLQRALATLRDRIRMPRIGRQASMEEIEDETAEEIESAWTHETEVAKTVEPVSVPPASPIKPSFLTPDPEDRPVKRTPRLTAPARTRATNETEAHMPAVEFRVPKDGRWDVPTDLFVPTDAGNQHANRFRQELDRLGARLVETLRTFKIDAQLGNRSEGARIVCYTVIPPAGTKVTQLESLEREIGIALRMPSVRIAPAPLAGGVAIEIPHPTPRTVRMRELLESDAYRNSKATLPLALGTNVEGKPIVSDLAQMPHLLVAGATGSGKSVCINTIITSLCVKHPPETLRLILADPKRVELKPYETLPHLLHPVIYEPDDIAAAVRWAVMEMERRYEILGSFGARNLSEYNRLRASWEPLEGEAETPENLPYIVIIVDELADLMMTEHRQPIESCLVKLAQKSRAVGIHVILATQRPDRSVVTGLLKANIPARIAFRVSAALNSSIILDTKGAEQLLGYGDMLFLAPGTDKPIRVQGALIETKETERFVRWCAEARPNAGPSEEFDILRAVHEAESTSEVRYGTGGERDALFEEALRVCAAEGGASTSLLQRRLGIGYSRAARIIDQLYDAGFIGEARGSKARDVLVSLEEVEAHLG